MGSCMSYLWRELSNDKYWRIQTTDPIIKKKLKRRRTAKLVGECFNHPMVIYKLQYYSPQKAKQSFMRLTGQKVQDDAKEGVFFAKTYPKLIKKDIPEVQK